MTAVPGGALTGAERTTCAEEVLHLLAVHGVEVLFLNPGTDSAPLQEAVASLSARGLPVPRIILCSFESVALAAAHGYWQMTRRPQAVFVHVDVGTQNLGAMVHNILRDRAGVVVLAGRTPYAEDADSPGSRDLSIHWQQDVPDQAGIVRGYAKWTAELTRAQDTSRIIGRAVQVAGGGIPGMAYVTMSRDVLMEQAGDPVGRREGRFARPSPPAVEPRVLEEVAEDLAQAERPVIITTRIGRSVAGATALAAVADLAAIPVLGRLEAVNLPTSHPMLVRDPAVATSLIRAADLVLFVECDVPWIPRHAEPPPDATIIQVESDPIKADMPLWTFPVDRAVTADGAVALSQLQGALAGLADREKERWDRRRAAVIPLIAEGGRAAMSGEAADQLGVEAVVVALNTLLRPEDLVVEEAVSNAGAVGSGIERTELGTLCSAGGPGLGWALGASVGIAAARPGRRVIAVVGDGAFMFGSPSAALCLASEAAVAIVVVVLNNDGYRASRLPVYALFPDGASAARGKVVGTRFVRSPNFAALAESCGALGVRVESPADLPGALEAAFDAAATGRSAVVDVNVGDGEH